MVLFTKLSEKSPLMIDNKKPSVQNMTQIKSSVCFLGQCHFTKSVIVVILVYISNSIYLFICVFIYL